MSVQNNGVEEINRLKQKQMLQIVSSSFYKELMRYGVDKSGIVSVSMNLLDFITEKNKPNLPLNEIDPALYYNFDIKNVGNMWEQKSSLFIDDVTITALDKKDIEAVTGWLHAPQIENMLLRSFPVETAKLKQDIVDNPSRKYFSICHQNEMIGIIGADMIDEKASKLEMKKLIGKSAYRGKGIGKKATFLFLYYAFEILNINKVFIHSQDTNINNININSRFGFGLEGILYKEVRVDGEFRDILRMSLLRSRWKELFNK